MFSKYRCEQVIVMGSCARCYVGNLNFRFVLEIQSNKELSPVKVFRLKPTSTEMRNYFDKVTFKWLYFDINNCFGI